MFFCGDCALKVSSRDGFVYPTFGRAPPPGVTVPAPAAWGPVCAVTHGNPGMVCLPSARRRWARASAVAIICRFPSTARIA
ncbi:hypothetical protein D9M71_410970 [compost metagenome]